MSNRWMTALAIAGLALGAGCDDEPEDETPAGEYEITVVENRDTCDGVRNDFGTTFELRSVDGRVEIEFGGFPPLTATVGPEGALSAQGVVEDNEDGTTTLRLRDVEFFQGGEVEGEGDLSFDGTFPDPEVTDPCVQEFTFVGQKVGAAMAPVLPTSP